MDERIYDDNINCYYDIVEFNMTKNELRESDLRYIANNIRRNYDKKFYSLEEKIHIWASYGRGIKKEVEYETRTLYRDAEKNLDYLNNILRDYERIGYCKTETFRQEISEQLAFYESEKRRLRQLRELIPLVTPLAQIKKKDKTPELI